MLTVPAKYIDPLNIALILLTCALAHLAPFYLLLFSYAVLGPAHYLTQISWLHDRRYFANSSLLAPAMGLFSVALVALTYYHGGTQPFLIAAILSAAIAFALISILPPGNSTRRNLIIAACIFLFLLTCHSPPLILFIAILIPTVMHIFVFTAAFMWAGAMKSRKKSAYLSVIALLAGAATFLIPAAAHEIVPDLKGLSFFSPIVSFMQSIGLSSLTATQLLGFLAYAYTYHYLNWFSKAEVIHWNRIPRRRMQAILAIYAVTLSLYAYSYALGLAFILLLSFAHVLLEFPLNLRTFAAIARGKV